MRRPANVGRRTDDGLPALTLVSEVPDDLRSSGVVVGAGRGSGARRCRVPHRARRRSRTPSPTPKQRREEPPAPEPSAAQAAARCTSVGPFRELSQAATAAAALRNAGYQPLQRVVEGDVWIGYWVYIPAIPTEQRSQRGPRQGPRGLREARIPDAYVIREQRQRQSRVARRVQRDQRRQPPARSRCARSASSRKSSIARAARRCTGSTSRSPPDQALDFDALQPPGRIIRLEQRACEAPG